MADVFEKAKDEEKKPVYRCWAKDCKHFGSVKRYHRDTGEPYHLCEYHHTLVTEYPREARICYPFVTKQANRLVVLRVETLCTTIEKCPYCEEARAAFEEMMTLLPKVLDERDYPPEKNAELRQMDMQQVPNRVRERLLISIVEQARRIAEEVGQLPAGTVRSLPTVATVNKYCEKIYKVLGSRGAV